MGTLLSTLVDPLKRELAVPGTFATVFPDTTDPDLVGSLADGFSEARLRKFFPDMTLAEIAGPPVDWETSEDLSLAGTAVVVLFTASRIIRSQIRALNTAERYKAGPTEFEIQRSATALKAELDFIQKRLDDIIREAKAATTSVVVMDGYAARVRDAFCGGFYRYEYGRG